MPTLCPRDLLLACLLAAAPAGARAAESQDACTGFIRSIPVVLTTRGIWCLDGNLTTAITAGYAIYLQASDATVDCLGHRIDGSAAGLASGAQGIGATDRSRITVRGCTISGFRDGVRLLGGDDYGAHLIEDNRFVENLYSGMLVRGPGSIIRRNQVLDTGGALNPSGVAYGIRAEVNAQVSDNAILGVRPAADPNGGIYVSISQGGTVSNNIVRGLARVGAGTAYGVYAWRGNGPKMFGNDITGPSTSNSIGVICLEGSGYVRGNFVTGMARGYYGCKDAGSNYPAP